MELRKDIINLYKLAVKYDKTHTEAIDLTTRHYYYKIHESMLIEEFKIKVTNLVTTYNKTQRPL